MGVAKMIEFMTYLTIGLAVFFGLVTWAWFVVFIMRMEAETFWLFVKAAPKLLLALALLSALVLYVLSHST